jgi:hypothetical protein
MFGQIVKAGSGICRNDELVKKQKSNRQKVKTVLVDSYLPANVIMNGSSFHLLYVLLMNKPHSNNETNRMKNQHILENKMYMLRQNLQS